MKKWLGIIIGLLILGCSIFQIKSKERNRDLSIYTDMKKDQEYFLDSNLFTQEDDLSEVKQKTVDMNLDGFLLKLKNDVLELYVNPISGAIRLKSKTTGYVWASDVLFLEDYDFNNAQKRQVRSGFEFTYRNTKNSNETINTLDSNISLKLTNTTDQISFEVDHSKSQIKFKYSITLTDSSIRLFLDTKSIEENGENKLTSITFFKYFGAVYRASIPSYAFIPSGNGGLIRYQENPPISSSYSASFYGTDFSYVQGQMNEVLSLPIFGVVHGVNQNSFLAEVKEGSTFAKLHYIPGNTGQNFNMIYPSFQLRETYLMPIPGSDSVLMIPDKHYESNIEMEYTILEREEANYIGMAKFYQKTLTDRNILRLSNQNNHKMHIEYFGSDYERGIFFKKNLPMTTTDQILEIDQELQEKNMTDLYYTLRGFNKGGYSESAKSAFKFNSKLGALNHLKDLNYSIYYNPVDFYSTNDRGRKSSLINMYNKAASIEIEKNAKYHGFTNVKKVIDNVSKTLKNEDNLAYDGIVNRLYGDKNNQFTRERTLQEFNDLIKMPSPMFRPNYDFYDQMNLYLNLNLVHDRLKFLTDSVPFLEILLRGFVPYYSTYLNFSANKRLDLLKCVEYGTYPAFLVTREESHLLANTLSNDLYATTYSRIIDLMEESYAFINDALVEVTGQKILQRNYLKAGVMEVVYENDVRIIVNYTNQDFKRDEVIVYPQNYKVVK